MTYPRMQSSEGGITDELPIRRRAALDTHTPLPKPDLIYVKAAGTGGLILHLLALHVGAGTGHN
jgi:hypothetical protein